MNYWLVEKFCIIFLFKYQLVMHVVFFFAEGRSEPTLFVLTPLLPSGFPLTKADQLGPHVCLASNSRAKGDDMVLNQEGGPITVSPNDTVWSTETKSYYSVAFSNKTIHSCEMNGTFSNNEAGTKQTRLLSCDSFSFRFYKQSFKQFRLFEWLMCFLFPNRWCMWEHLSRWVSKHTWTHLFCTDRLIQAAAETEVSLNSVFQKKPDWTSTSWWWMESEWFSPKLWPSAPSWPSGPGFSETEPPKPCGLFRNPANLKKSNKSNLY